MEYNTLAFFDIPIGLINDLISDLTLVGQLDYIKYRNSKAPYGIDFCSELNSAWDNVDVIVGHYIDEDLTYGFTSYVKKKYDVLKNQSRKLEDYLELKN